MRLSRSVQLIDPLDPPLEAASIAPPHRRNWLLRGALLLGGLAVAGGTMGANWATTYVRSELVPQLSHELTRILQRPIQLGAIEQVSWSGLRVGRSVIPATATDPDTLSVEAIDVRFNPIQALRQQQIQLTITLVRPSGYFEQSPDGQWLNLNLKFDSDEPIEVETIRLEDATLTLAPQPVVLDTDPLDPGEVWDTSAHPRQLTLRHVAGALHLQEQGQRLRVELAAQPVELDNPQGSPAGKIQLKADVRPKAEQFKIALQTQALQLNSLSTFIPTDFKVLGGKLDAQISAQIQPDQPVRLSGSAQLRDLSARAKGEPNLFSGVSGNVRLRNQDIWLSQGKLNFGLIPFFLDGKINLQQGFDLKARVEPLEAAPFMQTLKLRAPFPVTGSLEAPNLRLTGSFEHPTLWGSAHAVTPIRFDRLQMASVVGRFHLDLGKHYLQLEQILATPVIGGSINTRGELWLERDDAKLQVEAQLPADKIASLYALDLPDHTLGQLKSQAQITVVHNDASVAAGWQLVQGRYPAQGKVSYANDILLLQDMQARIADGRINAEAELKPTGWQAQLNAEQLPLNQLAAELPGKLQAQLQAQGRDFSLESLQAQGVAQVLLEQGGAKADLSAKQGRWQAEVTGAAPLKAITALPDLPGQVNGEVMLRGSLAQLNLAQTQAEGKLALADTGILPQPVTADFAWNGDKLHLKQASTEHIAVEGWVTPNDSLLNSALDLKVNVQDYDLAKLPLSNPLPVAVTGLVNLKGRVAGTAAIPKIDSKVSIRELAIQNFKFEPLRGQIQSQPDQQIELDLQGNQDRIALRLDANYRPASFAVRLDQAVAEGQRVGERLLASLRNFNLEQINLVPAASLGQVRGQLAGNFDVNLATNLAPTQPLITANFAVTQPGLGAINAQPTPAHVDDQLTGQLLYQNGIAALNQTVLQIGSSRYRLAAKINPETAQFSSQIAVEQAQFQDLLSLLPPDQLTALIQQLVESRELPGNLPVQIPTAAQIAQLDGLFSGALSLHSTGGGLTAEFGLQGQNWQLADYKIGQVAIAAGQFDGQRLLLPSVQAAGFGLRLNDKPQQFDAQFGFAGQVSPTAVAGQVQLLGIDLPQVEAALQLPLELEGQVHATAEISGSPSQPDLTGALHLEGVNLRDLAIDEAQVGFSWINRRLQLESWQGLDAQALGASQRSGKERGR